MSSFAQLVTVVMLTHNRPVELTRTLSHLSALPEKPRVIVVDNGSTGGTTAGVVSRFPGVALRYTGANLGAAGRNLAVNQVETPYVAFCDDDTWWAPHSLATAVALLEQHPYIAVLNANILVGERGKPDSTCRRMATSPLASVPGVGPRLIGFMAGACVMRTHCFSKAGGYCPRFFIGGEESLLAMDILDAGYDIVFAPTLTVHHWPSERRHALQREDLLLRNAIWTAWLRLPGRMALQHTMRTLRQSRNRSQYWRVVKGVLKGLPAILAKRRPLQPRTLQLLKTVWQHETR